MQKDILPAHKRGLSSVVMDAYKDQYFSGGRILRIEFIGNDSAHVVQANGLEHGAVYLQGFGWLICKNGNYYGIYEKEMTGRLVIAKRKADFFNNQLISKSDILWSVHPSKPMYCDDDTLPDTCLGFQIENEIFGIMRLKGRDYVKNTAFK